jgi:fumarate hydratase class II
VFGPVILYANPFSADPGRCFALNVFKPLIVCDTLQSIRLSIRLIGDAPHSFYRQHGGRDAGQCSSNRGANALLLDAGNCAQPYIGYDKAAQVAHKAPHDGTTLWEAAVALGFVTPEEFDE